MRINTEVAGDGVHNTELAYLLLTQQSRVRFSLPKTFSLDAAEIY